MDEKPHPNLEMSVADLLQTWPQVIPLFLRNHMACVGCSMAAFETLGDAARIYGVLPERFLDEIQQTLLAQFRGKQVE